MNNPVYFMHLLWFLSLIIWTAKECCMMLLLILGFFAKLALTCLCNYVFNCGTIPERELVLKKKIFHICSMGLQKACLLYIICHCIWLMYLIFWLQSRLFYNIKQ